MKKFYHICLSAGDEVYCRSKEDYLYCFNCIALAMAKTESDLMADAEMATHLHECVRTSDPRSVVKVQRYAYTRYFNSRYHRKGRLGERIPFILELDGLHHQLAAITYSLRNPLHHGVAASPFGYPFSSINVLFREDLHCADSSPLLKHSAYYKHLPQHVKCPPGYSMNSSGLILRENVIDVTSVEHMFGTPRAFLYYMNRLSGEEWQKEQEKDKNGKQPITLDLIEHGVAHQSMPELLSHEHGRSDYRAKSDLWLCEKIDNELVPSFGATSVYTMSLSDKNKVANMLYDEMRIPKKQIIRCMAMNYSATPSDSCHED